MGLNVDDVLVDVLNLDAEIRRCEVAMAELRRVPSNQVQDWRTQTRVALQHYRNYLTALRNERFSLLKELNDLP